MKERRHSGQGMSLEHKIPLLITALLAGLLSLTVTFAYQEVRSSAAMAGMQRLESLAADLGEILSGALEARLETVTEVAGAPALRLFLSSGDDEYLPEVDRVLSTISTGAQPLPISLVSTSGEFLHTYQPDTIEVAGGTLPEEGTFGSLFEEGGTAYYYHMVPVEAETGLVGYIAEARRFGSPQTAEQIANLTGSDASVFLAGEGEIWAGLDGSVRRAPMAERPEGPLGYSLPEEGEQIGYAQPVDGTPWSLVVELPRSSVLARPDAFLRQISPLLAILTALGAIGAWMLSRSFTRPMKRLSRAAESIAAGKYGERVELNRSDEIGALALTFNAMSAEVQKAQESLRGQVEQATALAGDLERANARLTELMVEADSARRGAEEASQAKSNFLATVSHELRTPINAIIGYTDLLMVGVDGSLAPSQVKHLERVQANGRHLIRLIDDVLDLAKIEAGHLEVGDTTGIAEDALEAAVAMNEVQASAKGVALVRNWTPECRSAYRGDPGRVEQILVNLVSNALKFTPAGGRVIVSCRESTREGADRNPGSVVIRVEDTGIGVSPEKREMIFHRFVQAESGYKRVHEGAGLGLAISRELARLMGGDITLDSREGSGSVFTLRLSAPVPSDLSPSCAGNEAPTAG